MIVLSTDMADTIAERGVPTDNVKVIKNFVIDEVNPEIKVPEVMNKAPGKFRVLFMGNIGRFQSLDTLVAAAKLLQPQDSIEFWFVGSESWSTNSKSSRANCWTNPSFFTPMCPRKPIMSVVAESDLGVVSLSPGVIKCAHPSKTMSYLEGGCQILALVEPNTSLSNFVTEEQIGFVVHESDAKQLSDAIKSAYEKWKANGANRDFVRETGRKHYGQEVVLPQWSRLIETIASSPN